MSRFNTRDDAREDQLQQTAKNICPIDKREEWLAMGKEYFFYCSNNMVVQSLQGEDYWAFDDAMELFKAAGIEKAEDETIQRRLAQSREVNIVFLDTGSADDGIEIKELLFPACFPNVKLVVPSGQQGRLKLGKVVVEAGCTLRLEQARVEEIDVKGRALLKGCSIACSDKLPCLFTGSAQHPICGNVEYRSCTFDNDRRVALAKGKSQGRTDFTISNISEQPWTVSVSTWVEKTNPADLGDRSWTASFRSKLVGILGISDRVWETVVHPIPARGVVTIAHTTARVELVFEDHKNAPTTEKFSYARVPNITITRPTVALVGYELDVP